MINRRQFGTFGAATLAASSKLTWAAKASSGVVSSASSWLQRRLRWPQRRLMEPDLRNSQRPRHLSKPVYESALVDDMEADRWSSQWADGWSVNGPATIEYSTERAYTGKRSLRFRTSQVNLDYIKEHRKPDGSFDGLFAGSSCARLTFGRSQDWSRFNRISAWIYVEGRSPHKFSNLQLTFECEGMPKGNFDPMNIHYTDDLIPGEWNRIFWEIPEFKRDKVTGLAFIYWTIGNDVSVSERILDFYIDQIELERVDPEPSKGWEVVRGRISFQHVGYLPTQEKVAYVSAPAEATFELVDADDGTVAATFPVKSESNERGQFQVLDFTEFNAPGRYCLRYGELTTRPFPISDDLWYAVIEKAMNFFLGERCGFDVPGVHSACHRDLQGRGPDGQIKIINGGWHDASDMCQATSKTAGDVYSMLRVYEQLRARRLRADLQARVLEEASWGLVWLLKTRFGKGYLMSGLTQCRIYTDNKVGTLDDMVTPAQQSQSDSMIVAGVLAYAGRLLKEVDLELAARSLEAAKEEWEFAQRGHWSAAVLDDLANGVAASIELYRVTGDTIYSGKAVQLGRYLLERQEQGFVDGIPVTGYFYEDAKRQSIARGYESPLAALCALCGSLDSHEDWMEWYGGALLASEYYYGQGAVISRPYCRLADSIWFRSELSGFVDRAIQSMNANVIFMEFFPDLDNNPERIRADILKMYEAGAKLSENSRLLNFPIFLNRVLHHTTLGHLVRSADLALATQLRNRSQLQSLVERQLQWYFGGNPLSQTFMYGAGYNYTTLAAYSPGQLVGALPVAAPECTGDGVPLYTQTVEATTKEIWGAPLSRMLDILSLVAVPAHVSGSAAVGATFRETRTGTSVAVKRGALSLLLPTGSYTVEYGGVRKEISVLNGGNYNVVLDPEHAINMVLSARRAGGDVVKLTALLQGAGEHALELRVYNGSVTASQAQVRVKLAVGREQSCDWRVRVADPGKPWAVVLIANGDMDGKMELFGTLHNLRGMRAA